MLENGYSPPGENIRFISSTLEEHEREEFTRMKVIKRQKAAEWLPFPRVKRFCTNRYKPLCI
ncbi:MAG: V-type ATP synthase subunit D [Ruthenibacterium lactatiformans]